MKIKVTSHVDEFMKEFAEVLDKAMEEIGLAAQNNATKEINALIYDTPPSPTYVRTGRLRASITYATNTSQGTAGKEADASDYKTHGTPDVGSMHLGTNVEYAPYVEFGTSRNMAERPYLRNSISNHMDEYVEILEHNFGKM